MGTTTDTAMAARILKVLTHILVLGAGAGLYGPASAQEKTAGIYGGIRAGITLTDNLFLAGSGNEESGTVLEVNPFVGYQISKPKLNANIEYGLRIFSRPEFSNNDTIRHSLGGSAAIAIDDTGFWLAGSAQTYDVNTSPFNSTSLDPAAQTSNRSRVTRVDFAPYYVRQIGARTGLRVGYRHSYSKVQGLAPARRGNSIYVQLAHDPNVKRLGWSLQAQKSSTEFNETGDSFDTGLIRAELLYRLSTSIRVSAGVQYNTNEAVANDAGDTSGLSPTVSAIWLPSNKTSLTVTASNPYSGSETRVIFTKRISRWAFGASFGRGLSNRAEIAPFGGVNTVTSDPNGSETATNVTDSLQAVSPFNPYVTGPIVRRRNFALTAHWEIPRNSVDLSASTSNTTSEASAIALPVNNSSFSELERNSIAAKYSRKLDPRTSAAVSYSLTDSTANAGATTARLRVVGLTWDRQINDNSAVRASYQNARQSATGTGTSYDENSLWLSYEYRF